MCKFQLIQFNYHKENRTNYHKHRLWMGGLMSDKENFTVGQKLYHFKLQLNEKNFTDFLSFLSSFTRLKTIPLFQVQFVQFNLSTSIIIRTPPPADWGNFSKTRGTS